MSGQLTTSRVPQSPRFPTLGKFGVVRLALIAATALFVASAVLWGTPSALERFAYGLLWAAWFVLSIGIGACFFVAIQHVVGAQWSVSLRRIAESLALLTIPGTLCLLPLAILTGFGSDLLFEWNNAEVVSHDELLLGKAAYLNGPFFFLRSLLYGLVWCGVAIFLWRSSKSGGDQLERAQKLSPIILIVLGLATTFASFDWIMSLEPHWYSTIFGIYLFSTCFVSALAALTLLATFLARRRNLMTTVSANRLHDLGKLLFGFNCFWAYIAFSQYLLIWYANIPEETVWFKARLNGGWEWISLALLMIHFLIPFLGMMPRQVKRNPTSLALFAVIILCASALDFYWLIYPSFETAPHFGIAELCLLISVISVSGMTVGPMIAGHEMIPTDDPRIEHSIRWSKAIGI